MKSPEDHPWGGFVCRHAAVILTVSTGLCVTAVVFAQLRTLEHRSMREMFLHQADQRTSAWITAIEDRLSVLNSLYALYESSEYVARDEFHSFVERSVLRYDGVKAVQWVPRVPGELRYEHEQQARRDGIEEYRIRECVLDGSPGPEHVACFPICYVEPLAENLQILGFDLGSDPSWRNLLERAATGDRMMVTTKAYLPGEGPGTGTFNAIQPVYRRSGLRFTEADCRENLQGYVVGVLDLGAMAECALAPLESDGIDIELLDVTAAEPRCLYRRTTYRRSSQTSGSDAKPGRNALVWEKPLSLGGERWVVRCSAAPGFWGSRHSLASLGSLVIGFLATCLAASYVRAYQTRYERVQRLVAEKTCDLETSRAELKKRNEFLHHILVSLVHPLYVIDAKDHTVRLSNQSIDDASSHRASQACYEMIHGRDRPCDGVAYACSIVEVKNTKKPIVIERQRSEREGRHRVLEVHAYPVLDAQGDVSEVIEYHLDVTERKQAEAMLRESEEKFRVLFESSTDAIMTLDPSTLRFTSGNPATMKMFKVRDEAEFVSKGPWEFSPEFQPDGTRSDDKAKIMIGKALQEGSNFVEWNHMRLDGEVFPATVLITRVVLGERTLLQATVRDITEAKRVEKQILEDSQIRSALNGLLRLSLDNLTMEEVLEQAIDQITSLPWFVLSKGVLFLADAKQETLVMAARRGLSASLLTTCARIPFGRCICGKAALSGQIEFVDCVNEQHEDTLDGVCPHGHYAVPILSADKVFGVVNIYVEERHQRCQAEEDFLRAAAAVLAGIIERKKAEDALQAGEERLRRTLDAAQTVAWEGDLHSNALIETGPVAAIFGQPESAICTDLSAFIERVHPEDREHVQAALQSAARRGQDTYEVEYRVPLPDGGIRWIQAQGGFERDAHGDPIRIRGIARDITGRKLAEEELRAQKDLLSHILANIPAFVFWKDRNSTFLGCNEALARSAGVDCPKDIVGKTDYDLVWKNDAEAYRQDDRRVMDSGEPRLAFEESQTTKEGNQITLLTSKVPLRDASGAVVGVLGVYSDITERKLAEKRQASLLDELESINRELKDFAHIVSHDLKAPLRAIRTLADWIMTDLGDRLGEEGNEQMRLLVGRADRMQNLIEGVLEYSRIGRVHEEHVSIDLKGLVAQVVEDLSPPERFSFDIEDNLPRICGEPTRIRQLFQNLLSNAIKYMDKERGVITVGCTETPEVWQFFVRDNGPGIDEKYFDRIFQIFQTLAPRDETESTGVGLTVVKKIVECHGGRIWVESQVGEGTTFLFTLPKTAMEAQNADDTVLAAC